MPDGGVKNTTWPDRWTTGDQRRRSPKVRASARRRRKVSGMTRQVSNGHIVCHRRKKGSGSNTYQVQKTELRLAHYVVFHNLNFRSIDHLSQLPRLMMNDSKIVQQISLKRPKRIKLIKNFLASVFEDNLVKEMENKKFSVYLFSNIANIGKIHFNQIKTHLLDLVPVDANHGTTKGLYILFSKSFEKLKPFILKYTNKPYHRSFR